MRSSGGESCQTLICMQHCPCLLICACHLKATALLQQGSPGREDHAKVHGPPRNDEVRGEQERVHVVKPSSSSASLPSQNPVQEMPEPIAYTLSHHNEGWDVLGFPDIDLLFFTKEPLKVPPDGSCVADAKHKDLWSTDMHRVHEWVRFL